MHIALIVNRTARRFARHPALVESLAWAARGRAAVHVTSTLEELRAAAGRAVEAGAGLVALAGGDGSLMAGLTALGRAATEARRPLPAIAALPGGTVSTVARNFGIAGDPTSWLARVLARPGHTRPWPSLAVRGDHETRLGFIFGTGLVARFFEQYYARGAPGYAGSAAMVARIFVESFGNGPLARAVLEPLPCRLYVEGRALAPEAWSLVCAAVVPNLGIHMLVTYRAAEDATRPHLVATSRPPRALGPRMPWVLAGRSLRGEHDGLVTSFALDFPAPDGPYVLDGELLRARRVEVGAGPTLRLWMP
ncbi:MAG: hypothetical protein HY908_24380 [Myxococcales bacterium]|nr:hypothetical protein [Myxococcales bacterium]